MKRILILLALSGAFAAAATATSYVALTDEALVDEATLVVRARVVRALDEAAAARPRHGWEVEVLETLKGIAPERLDVTVPGGRNPAGLSFHVYGVPSLRDGEEAILFLHPRRDGSYGLAQLFLGAFHEVQAGSRRLAVRDLREARQVTIGNQAAAAEPVRDAEAFAAWVKERATGRARAADYLVADAESRGLRSLIDPFTLFEVDGHNLRWDVFDSGGTVQWRMLAAGQPGLSTAFNDFKTGLAAWNNDPSTPIKYNYAGTTASDGGLCPDDPFAECFDNKNSLSPEDPHGDIDGSFSCSGGVLAIGGPWFDPDDTMVHNGQTYIIIVGADIVTQNNLKCFFDQSPNKAKVAQELYGHELGHTLGVGHACGDGDGPDPDCANPLFEDALMNAFIHDDGRGARLNADDRAAIEELYGAIQPPAAPGNLTGGAISHTAAELSWSDNSNDETSFRIEAAENGGAFTERGTAAAGSTDAVINGLTPGASVSVRVRAQGPGGFSGYSNVSAFAMPASTPACVPDADTGCLLASRFRVEVERRTGSDPAPVAALRAPAGSDSAVIFYFFNADNWELLLKVINACPLNSRFWVFYSATTNVELDVRVTDTQSGRVQRYFNPLNQAAPPVQDSNAFATCP